MECNFTNIISLIQENQCTVRKMTWHLENLFWGLFVLDIKRTLTPSILRMLSNRVWICLSLSLSGGIWKSWIFSQYPDLGGSYPDRCSLKYKPYAAMFNPRLLSLIFPDHTLSVYPSQTPSCVGVWARLSKHSALEIAGDNTRYLCNVTCFSTEKQEG